VRRKRLLFGGLAAALLCATAGGLTWAILSCDARPGLARAAVSPRNAAERFAFACGYLWHSEDGGQIWRRSAVGGLPLGAREGLVAVDRRPGRLYLGLLLTGSSSFYCWNCAWKFLHPAIFTSDDGGRSWQLAYQFKRGPTGDSGFLGLFGDPLRAGHVWAVIKNVDQITYYASGTGGQFWRNLCVEYTFVGSGRCSLPRSILRRLEPPAGEFE
jgi:photosystem II stability/assembly factor-like uncharacterized protein